MRGVHFAPLIAIVVSCTFPSVTYDDDGSIPNDATIEASDDGGLDASDGEVVPEAEDDGNDPCDQDHDHYRSKTCDGGTDCNDNDPRVNPGVTAFVTDVPDGAPNGDWNCDGKIEPQYPVFACVLGVSCTNDGFVNVVNCGQAGEYDTCKGLCAKTNTGNRVQGCR